MQWSLAGCHGSACSVFAAASEHDDAASLSLVWHVPCLTHPLPSLQAQTSAHPTLGVDGCFRACMNGYQH